MPLVMSLEFLCRYSRPRLETEATIPAWRLQASFCPDFLRDNILRPLSVQKTPEYPGESLPVDSQS